MSVSGVRKLAVVAVLSVLGASSSADACWWWHGGGHYSGYRGGYWGASYAPVYYGYGAGYGWGAGYGGYGWGAGYGYPAGFASSYVGYYGDNGGYGYGGCGCGYGGCGYGGCGSACGAGCGTGCNTGCGYDGSNCGSDCSTNTAPADGQPVPGDNPPTPPAGDDFRGTAPPGSSIPSNAAPWRGNYPPEPPPAPSDSTEPTPIKPGDNSARIRPLLIAPPSLSELGAVRERLVVTAWARQLPSTGVTVLSGESLVQR